MISKLFSASMIFACKPACAIYLREEQHSNRVQVLVLKESSWACRLVAEGEAGREVKWYREIKWMTFNVIMRALVGTDILSSEDLRYLFPHALQHGRAPFAPVPPPPYLCSELQHTIPLVRCGDCCYAVFQLLSSDPKHNYVPLVHDCWGKQVHL